MPRSVICVDASVVVALVTPEEQSQLALDMWGEWMRAEARVIAPTLLLYEVTSALRRKAARGTLSQSDARRALEEALALDIELLTLPELCLAGFDLAGRFQRSAAYDTCYLALAQAQEGEFWTADERLYNAVKERFAAIRWLGDAG